ncbi:hypothetical protein FDENT_1502 [Fusarium denticulatum]|uniref:Uncharacterized protein n=1 Tax=Fusarium denticulatum TaxID=48507 RepID=A0A8H6CW08_9HYPO|nr:hypothetical protein FDENT_1502 [Fusarium denticulatum]
MNQTNPPRRHDTSVIIWKFNALEYNLHHVRDFVHQDEGFSCNRPSGTRRTQKKHYSRTEIDCLEGELSPLDALTIFMRPGVIIPPCPAVSHTTEDGHLYGCDQKIKHVSDTEKYKRLELTGENTYVDLIKAPLSDLDRQICVVRSRAHFEQKVAKAFDVHIFQDSYRVKAPTNIQFFGDWKKFCQDHQVPPAPGTTADKVHSLPQIVQRALINQYHPRGDSPLDPEVTKELLLRKEPRIHATPRFIRHSAVRSRISSERPANHARNDGGCGH